MHRHLIFHKDVRRHPKRTRSDERRHDLFCRELGRMAVRSLYQELALYPKPGLVSLVDNGSHRDMDAAIFMRSLFSLRHYFVQISLAGMAGAPFEVLRQLGIVAEARMLRATGGINTHRGAIFCLGMLCAAIASCRAQGIVLSAAAIQANLLIQWGEGLARHTLPVGTASHGAQVAALHAVGGAREEGALGFPSLFHIALPQMHATRAAGGDERHAKIDALFALMAHISDTNVYHRGAEDGAARVKNAGRDFLDAGGTASADWMPRALVCHAEFVRHRLSPGGAADLLAGSCLVMQACTATGT
ncbi:triphosphoribosyl-dephospho-CoA synthase MdcB [Herbaspirillum sp. RTI4]|uniref:triphosphoribosyl-dephospho-CoA synthase MdcB n=1 Tax=Herbaspirillum sp. RTI4 TaxID=3048640 RepID=UPI002AB32D97|nr:triphosphoribosyl-dephospho-CoA synthase MdcB [Herbaspirillum sp. RTI4]MDY7580098.1 triphosphoribosyl-dephospho-CoA synthase MdcB [Herbaspirillum sp. RTI4]MEA9983121.1 triphosphoribosyl-dephospho-CoA synthase MdcB [Herbaspirillum sp. RTI4]